MLELQDLKDFSIHSWYENFKDVCLETILIEVPQCLTEKFQTDDCDINLKDLCTQGYIDSLINAINKFQGKAFIKSNWHAPMDAKMFSFGNELKVTNLQDFILYLSTSNIISEDFSVQNSFPFYLALKPWISVHPASEFRCIVINKMLRGITPRDWPTYYQHFKDEGPQIIEKLNNFFRGNIKERFPRLHYTFDVIVSFPDEPYILDFNPLNNKTNLYAFNWKELTPLLNKDCCEEIAPIFRYLDSDIGIMTKSEAARKFTCNQVP